MIQELKIDEQLRDLFPPLTPEEFDQLEENILAFKGFNQDNTKWLELIPSTMGYWFVTLCDVKSWIQDYTKRPIALSRIKAINFVNWNEKYLLKAEVVNPLPVDYFDEKPKDKSKKEEIMDKAEEIKHYEKLNKQSKCITSQITEEEKVKYGIGERNNIKKMTKKLLINEEFRNLLPPLPQDTYDELEKNILKDGCTSAIALWNGYIADGHNRYKICTKHNLPFETYNLAYQTKDEVIDWMISIQLGRRNNSDIQTAYLRGLQYSREKKKQGGDRKSEESKAQSEPLISTSQKIAEQYNVSEATIKRDEQYAKAVDKIAENVGIDVKNKILNKDISISKEDVKKLSEMDIDTQKKYLIENEDKKGKRINIPKQEEKQEEKESIEQNQNAKSKKCIRCGEEKSIKDDFYEGHNKCKECEQPIPEKKKNNDTPKDDMDKTIEYVKTSKNVDDCIVVENEIECVEIACNDLIEQIDSRFFTIINVFEKMDKEQIEIMVDVLNQHIEKINKLKNKFKGEC